MQIDTATHGELLEVAPKGRLDSNTSPELEKALLERIGAGQTKITVDFGGIDYVSSAGLRVLLVAAKRTAAAKGQFSMHSMSPEIREVFEISGFLTILKVYPDLNAVLAAG
ncbi:STAS domain-containing protein [Thalassobaculum salexigens]|uniref:STAS domain-containing protein n=1 Tax=Thalassobaculum salexigens TaxID=455360 RepID=UPI00248D4576|nr:STAS domain-containing protein [Thalassobaculum salexigens]